MDHTTSNHVNIFSNNTRDDFSIFASSEEILVFKNAIPIIGIKRSSRERFIPKAPLINSDHSIISIPAIFGVVESEHQEYLVLITEIENPFELFGKQIFAVKSIKLLKVCLKSSSKGSGVRSRLREFLSTGFYFSYSDSLLFRVGMEPENKLLSPFCWNSHAIRKLLGEYCENSDFIPGFMQGFLGCSMISQNQKLFLISRRSYLRSGPRFKHRGADAFGSVANFVETEAILELENTIESFVQVRGSLPFFWKQEAVNSEPQLGPFGRADLQAITKHLEVLNSIYSYEKVIIANLLSLKNTEAILTNRLKDILRKLHMQIEHYELDINFLLKSKPETVENDVKVIADSMKLDLTLVTKVSDKFLIDKKQKTLVRSNCLDCVDRTNLFQMLLFENVFSTRHANLVNKDKASWRKLWTQQANRLSELYTGANSTLNPHSLHSSGLFYGIESGFRSLSRYISKNFDDDLKFEAGKLAISESCFSARPSFLVKKPFFPMKLLFAFFRTNLFEAEQSDKFISELKEKIVNCEKFAFLTFTNEKSNKFDTDSLIQSLIKGSTIQIKRICLLR